MEIVIYDASWNSSPSALKPEAVSIGKIAKSLGYYLLVISLAVGLYAALPSILKEVQYRFGPKQEEVVVKANFGQVIKNEEITKQKLAAEEAEKYGVPVAFSIVIPKIDAKAAIVPNVDPGSKEEYQDALKQGVAHAYGTGFPGNNKNIFLFAHSTNAAYNVERYNAIFYLLKELVVDDRIIVFYSGLKYEYQVTEKKTIEADDTGWLLEETGHEQLILQTCWPPGTSLKRLIVVAKPI